MSPILNSKLPRATLEQKIHILNYYHQSGKPQSETVERFKDKFSISTSSFSEWLKNESDLRDRYGTSNIITKNSKRKVKFKYEKINEAMDALVKKRLQENLPINEPILREYWSIYAHQFGVDDPKRLVSFSHGWLSQFKKRHGLDRKSMNGDSDGKVDSGESLADDDYSLPLVERDERYTPYEVNQLLNSSATATTVTNAAQPVVLANVQQKQQKQKVAQVPQNGLGHVHLHNQPQSQSVNQPQFQALYNNNSKFASYPYMFNGNATSPQQQQQQVQQQQQAQQQAQQVQQQQQQQAQQQQQQQQQAQQQAQQQQQQAQQQQAQQQAQQQQAQAQFFHDPYPQTTRSSSTTDISHFTQRQNALIARNSQVQQTQPVVQPQVSQTPTAVSVSPAVSIEAQDIERFIYMFADKFFAENNLNYPNTKKIFDEFKNSFFNERMLNLRNNSTGTGRAFDDFFLRGREK